MPLYEYGCTACGEEIEVRQKISDDPVTTCPKCGRDALERHVSRSSFALKGSGWYSDGYGGQSKGAASGSAKPAPATPAPKKPEGTGSSGSS